MKIALHIETTKLMTGPGRYMNCLLKEYLTRFPEHSYILYRVAGLRNLFPSSVFSSLRKEKVDIRTFGLFGSMIHSIREVFPIDDLYLRDADVIHFQGNHIPSLSSRKKIVVTIHDLVPLILPEIIPKYMVKRWQKWIHKFRNTKFDWIIADSESTRKDLIEIGEISPLDRIRVIPLAISPEYGQSIDEKTAQATLERLKLSSPYLLSVGTIEPRKNYVRLIQAYNMLRKENIFSGKLVIVGKRGWMSEPIFRAYNNALFRSDILLLGYLSNDEIRCLYQKAKLVAFVSLYEGFGFPLLEAFASKVSVISSNKGSLPEVGGEAAVYVDPYDAASIAEGIKTVLLDESLAAKLRMKGLERLKAYSWEKTARETFELYLK